MVALTVGTGLGGAIVINGQLYRGSFGMAAELGHLPMVPDGDHCGCGLRGCAERYTSGTSLENFAKSAVRRRPQDAKRLMELCGGDISKLEGPMVSQAAQEGDVLGLYAFPAVGGTYPACAGAWGARREFRRGDHTRADRYPHAPRAAGGRRRRAAASFCHDGR